MIEAITLICGILMIISVAFTAFKISKDDVGWAIIGLMFICIFGVIITLIN